MSKESNRCPTVLLSDEPTCEDAFAHARTAEAISELIGGEEGGKCIGLVGSWGSGKSSVVEILKEKLRGAAGEKVGVFVFDAWAHQGDPLRRTFLEQLIDQLKGRKWLLEEDEEWANKKRDELSQRRQTTHVTKDSALTTGAAIFALLVLLLPLGYQMFVMSISSTNKHPLAETFGIISSFAPFLLVAGGAAWWKHENKKHESQGDEPDQGRSLWSLVVRDSREEHWSNTIRTPDPTSVEFQSVFGKLLRKSLIGQERKLLIVIDNLDRVDVKDALEIWSTMRTFFDFGARRNQEWLSRLWLLVPFDEGSVRQLWAQSVASGNPNGELLSGRQEEPRMLDVARSFTDKTFQVTFRVSPPLLSNWHGYLYSQLKAAFPEHQASHFHPIYRMYDLRVVSGRRPPTPREIKLFVNSIGALHRQWQDEIPLHLQALYVLLAKEGGDLGSKLVIFTRDKDILLAVPVDMVGKDWRESIAAIHFNVRKPMALQSLMGSALERALYSGNVEKLKELSGVTGFDHVLEKVAEQGEALSEGAEASKLAVAASALSQLPESDLQSRRWSWVLICRAAGKVKRWPDFDDRVAQGVLELTKRERSSDFVKKLITAAKESLRKEEGGPNPSPIETWLKGAIVLITGLRTDYQKDLRECFGVVGSAGTYLDVIAAACESSEGKTACEFLPPECPPEEVLSSLGETIGKGEFEKSHEGVALLLEQLHPLWSWGEFAEGPLNGRLSADAQLEISELDPLLSLLTNLSAHQNGADLALLSLAKDGFIAFHLSYASSDTEVAALCLLPLLRAQSEGNTPSQTTPQSVLGMQKFAQIMKSPEEGTVEAFACLLLRLGKVDFMFEVPKKAPNTAPFVHAVLKRIAGQPDGCKWISPQRIIEERQMLREACGEEGFSQIAKESARASSLIKVLIERGFDPALASLYAVVLEAEPAEQNLNDFLVDGLRGISEEDWLEELSNEGEVLGLLLSLLDAGAGPSLSVPFGDALVGHAEALIEEELRVERLRKNWARLLSAMDEDQRRATRRRILQVVCESSQPTDEILEIYGDELQDSQAVLEEREKVIFGLARNFFERLRPAELRWLCALVERVPDLLSSATRTAQKDFRERLKAALKKENSEDEVKEALNRLAELAGVKKETKERKDGSEGPKKT